MKRGRLGFLVVAAAIVIAAGLLWPQLSNGPRSPRTCASSEVHMLVAAIDAYHCEFGSWPPQCLTANTALVRVLSGANPRQIVFMEIGADLGERSFLDPWKSPYHFLIQDQTSLLVWSNGPNREDERGRGDDIALNRSIQPEN